MQPLLSAAESAPGESSRAELVLRARGISEDLARRYVEFERGDWATFADGHGNPEAHHKGLVSQSGGYVVLRWDISGARLPSYIRFDHKLWTYKCSLAHHPFHPGKKCRPKRHLTRYIYPSADALDGSSAMRLDVHPLVKERLLASREPIYFALEGCLKSDALASHGKVAISVPSVTLWKVSEEHLAPFLKVLRAAPVVYLIPDSDYNRRPVAGPEGQPLFINEQVRHQTDKAVAFYRAHGIRALFLVPPYLPRQRARLWDIDHKERFKQGVDDHLAHGGNLGKWDCFSNPLGVHTWEYGKPVGLWLPPLPRQRKDRAIPRDTAFLTWLLETHGPVGLFEPQDAARVLGWSADTILRAWHALEDRGVLRVWLGKARGEGQGNAPHLFRYEVQSEAALQAA